jgi:hypothetical protein
VVEQTNHVLTVQASLSKLCVVPLRKLCKLFSAEHSGCFCHKLKRDPKGLKPAPNCEFLKGFELRLLQSSSLAHACQATWAGDTDNLSETTKKMET